MASLDAVQLPDYTLWEDEHAWTPVAQVETYTLTGALVIETATRQAGRPITLRCRGMTHAVLAALYALVEQAGLTMTLTLPDGRAFSVMFRQSEKPLEPSRWFAPLIPAQADEPYDVIVRLLTV